MTIEEVRAKIAEFILEYQIAAVAFYERRPTDDRWYDPTEGLAVIVAALERSESLGLGR
jgi:hypothetical protein